MRLSNSGFVRKLSHTALRLGEHTAHTAQSPRAPAESRSGVGAAGSPSQYPGRRGLGQRRSIFGVYFRAPGPVQIGFGRYTAELLISNGVNVADCRCNDPDIQLRCAERLSQEYLADVQGVRLNLPVATGRQR